VFEKRQGTNFRPPLGLGFDTCACQRVLSVLVICPSKNLFSKIQLQLKSLIINVRQMEACVVIMHVLCFALAHRYVFQAQADISSGFARASTWYCF
jgi:hypothetical protein